MHLRNPLVYSLLLNGILAGNLVWRALPSPQKESTLQTSPLPSPIAATALPEATPVQTTPSPQPFQWSSLESTDYPTYIANLRQIGCPEPTLRDIISGDLESIYAAKRAAISAKNLNSSALAQALAALRIEKQTLLEQILQPTCSSSAASLSTSAPSPSPLLNNSPAASSSPASDTARLPLVYQSVPVETLQMTERETAIMDRLRQAFIHEIGGPNQLPNDPLYLERWEKASDAADQRIKSLLGPEFYTAYKHAIIQQQAKAQSL